MSQHSQSFREKFNPLIKLALRSPWMSNNLFYNLEIYNEELIKQRNHIEVLWDVTVTFKSKLSFDQLSFDFRIFNSVSNLHQMLPHVSFDLFTELDLSTRKVSKFIYPKGKKLANIARLRSKDPTMVQVPQVSSMSSPPLSKI
jgi:hypothetical protein